MLVKPSVLGMASRLAGRPASRTAAHVGCASVGSLGAGRLILRLIVLSVRSFKTGPRQPDSSLACRGSRCLRGKYMQGPESLRGLIS